MTETTSTPGGQRDELTSRLVGRAMKDETFRQELLSNPRAAISQELGVTIPAGIGITVHEETSDMLHLVLPAHPLPADGRLSDADLDRVAGGMDDWLRRLVCTNPQFGGGDTRC